MRYTVLSCARFHCVSPEPKKVLSCARFHCVSPEHKKVLSCARFHCVSPEPKKGVCLAFLPFVTLSRPKEKSLTVSHPKTKGIFPSLKSKVCSRPAEMEGLSSRIEEARTISLGKEARGKQSRVW
jgi:hypothetical protein